MTKRLACRKNRGDRLDLAGDFRRVWSGIGRRLGPGVVPLFFHIYVS
jgi:hypothetical protein